MTLPDIPLGEWMEALVEFCLTHFSGAFDVISRLVGGIVGSLEVALAAVPAPATIGMITALALWRIGWRFALFSGIALMLLLGMGLWLDTMATLALIIASAIISLAIGMPLGVLTAKSRIAELVVRPLLDLMQTLPPFVYLIPAAMFFGLGKVPGTIATIIFAMPPAVRLTDLGIRTVDRELVEAGQSFGCTPGQLLRKVQLPLAMPSIMAGLNQTIMLSLSMVVIASMIGAGGLGNEVLAGIQRLDIGRGFEGGFGVVVLAIVLDRLTQSFGTRAAPRTILHRLLRSLFTPGRRNARSVHGEQPHEG